MQDTELRFLYWVNRHAAKRKTRISGGCSESTENPPFIDYTLDV